MIINISHFLAPLNGSTVELLRL